MTKNIFVRKKTDVRETGQSGPAQFFLATVASVTAAEGVSIIPDGQTEAVPKAYKVLTAGTAPPAVGDRVVVMRHSGTCVILGAIGEPEDMDADARITDVETELGRKVAKAGDTMTGLLNINRETPGVIAKTIGRASSETVATNTNSYGFRVVDKNGDVVALYTDRYETTGENGAFIGGYRMVNGTNTGNNLRLLVDAAGNKLVYVTSPAAWRTALNAVNKAGDTLTGDLNLRSTENTIGTVPETTVSDRRLYFRDKANTLFGKLQSVFARSGQIGMQLGVQRTVNGTSVGNDLILYIDANGNPSVYLTSAQIWRLALGLGTSGALPITIAQGGTGSTAVESESTIANIIAAASGFSITTAGYCSWGKVAMIYVAATVTAATSSGWHTVGTVVSGKRPAMMVFASELNLGASNFLTDGKLQVYGTLTANQKLYLFASYLLA